MGAESTLFLREAFDLLGKTTIRGVLYGITFSLYCLCARLLYLQLQAPDKRRRARFSLGYISFFFFCLTVDVAVDARVRQLAYINHVDDFPGGPLKYTNNPYDTISGVLAVIIEVSTTAIQVGH
jgi:hypothetical protein